jgi:hypothetical protein
VIGAIAIHAGLAAMWVCVPHEATVARSEPSIAVSIVEPAPPVPVPVPGHGGGGGGGGAKARSAPRARMREPAFDLQIDRGGGTGHGTGGGTGDGNGFGSGPGSGGVGGGLAGFSGALPEPPPPPAPKAASKARPPRLIYPSHHADAGDDSPPFIARVTVDTDGYVVGARLVTGTDRARASAAATAIWRFRYAPALDDAGRAVSATVDQDFLLE